MAQSIKISKFTDQLISAIAEPIDKDDSSRYQYLHEITLKGLKSHSYGRTNQFEVYNRLDGLEEKFRILNREDLGDALRQRLNELSARSDKWTPDVLSLLLELSNKPVTETNVEDVGLFDSSDLPPSPTWAEIIANDPLSDDDVWDCAGYSVASSEDDEADNSPEFSTDTDVTQKSSPTSVNSNGNQARALTVSVDTSLLGNIRESQFWADHGSASSQSEQLHLKDGKTHTTIITELQAVREVIFLLMGLPTSLFHYDVHTGSINSNLRYALQHSSNETFHNLLQSYATLATQLHHLRAFAKIKQKVALMQTFRAAVEDRLRVSNIVLTAMQKRLVDKGDGIVSLIDTYAKVQTEVRPLQQLAGLVTQIQTASTTVPFLVLELLYEQTWVNQSAGSEQEFAYIANIFFECFHTYIEPIREWMEHGELTDTDELFFVVAQSNDGGLASLWHDRYALRQDALGKLHAPRFLHTAAKKIFHTGKCVVFLKQLGAYDDTVVGSLASEPRLDYQSLYGQTSSNPLAPFSELFDVAFNNWIESKHHSASQVLRERLYSECGLWRSLDALNCIYLHKDGSLTSVFTTTVFNKIDRGKEAWNDRFLLTELAQGAFGSLPHVDTHRLAVRSTSGGYRDVHNRRRSVKILSNMSITYSLPWPISNIIKAQTLSTYQRIFTFLMQVSRVKYTLERRRLLSEKFSVRDNEDGEVDLSYHLRHRLLWLANTVYTYLTDIVLGPSCVHMRKEMTLAVDVDAMILVHDRFVLHLEDKCLISKKLRPIHQAILSLLDLGIQFSDAHAQYAGEKSFDSTNRSISSNLSQIAPWRRRRRRDEDYGEHSTEDEEEDGGADTSYISFQETAYVDRLRKMKEQFERLREFVTVGLRGVSRAGGEPCWEMLAANLLWNRETDFGR